MLLLNILFCTQLLLLDICTKTSSWELCKISICCSILFTPISNGCFGVGSFLLSAPFVFTTCLLLTGSVYFACCQIILSCHFCYYSNSYSLYTLTFLPIIDATNFKIIESSSFVPRSVEFCLFHKFCRMTCGCFLFFLVGPRRVASNVHCFCQEHVIFFLTFW